MISRQDFFVLFQFISTNDSTKGATGATAIVPEFLDALTLFQPGRQHQRGRTKISPWLRIC